MASARIEHHLVEQNLQDSYLSAYRIRHFTETALLKAHHEIVTVLMCGSIDAGLVRGMICV